MNASVSACPAQCHAPIRHAAGLPRPRRSSSLFFDDGGRPRQGGTAAPPGLAGLQHRLRLLPARLQSRRAAARRGGATAFALGSGGRGRAGRSAHSQPFRGRHCRPRRPTRLRPRHRDFFPHSCTLAGTDALRFHQRIAVAGSRRRASCGRRHHADGDGQCRRSGDPGDDHAEACLAAEAARRCRGRENG